MLKSVTVAATAAFVVAVGLGGQASAEGNQWSGDHYGDNNHEQHTIISYSKPGSKQYRGSERDHSYAVSKHESNYSYSSYNYTSVKSVKNSYVKKVSDKSYDHSYNKHDNDKHKYEDKKHDYKQDHKQSSYKHANYKNDYKKHVSYDYEKDDKHKDYNKHDDYKKHDYKKHDYKKYDEPKHHVVVKKVVHKPVKYVKHDYKKDDHKKHDYKKHNYHKYNKYDHYNHNNDCWIKAVNANNSHEYFKNGSHVKVGTNLWLEAMGSDYGDEYDWYIRHDGGHWNMVHDHDDYIDYTVWEKGSFEFKAVPKHGGSDCSSCVIRVYAY